MAMKAYWTKERVTAALADLYKQTGVAPASGRIYDELQQRFAKGHTGGMRPYPGRHKVLAHFPSMREAFKAAGVDPDAEVTRPRPDAPDDGKKRCSRCRRSADDGALFARHARTADGLAGICRSCQGLAIARGSRAAKSDQATEPAGASDSGSALEPVPASGQVLARVDELTSRVAALEHDRGQLLTVVRSLVEGHAEDLEQRRELVRVGIVIGATAAASSSAVPPPYNFGAAEAGTPSPRELSRKRFREESR